MAENLKTLYYFTKAEYAFSNINDGRVKISDIAKLNDTFDVFTPASRLKEERIKARSFVKQWAGLWGVLCMSDCWRSPLMWGHYADHHKGICIGFDADISRFKKIKYIEERLNIEDFGKKSFDEMGSDELIKMMHFKFSAWSYEREYRYFVLKRNTVLDDGNLFLEFNDWLRPKKLILGSRCELSKEQKNWVSNYQEQGNEIFRARSAFRSFRMVKDRLWKLNA